MGRLENRFAVITGGASGIGRAIAKAYLEEGAKVLIADLKQELANKTAVELEGFGEIHAFGCDVTKSDDVRDLADEALKIFGKVNVLVNNAGLSGRGMIAEISEDTIDALLNVNLKGVIICAKVFAPILKEAKDSTMINMSSQAGKRGWPELSVYGATKAGVLGMNRALAVELAPEVRVNAICPGYIFTEMNGEFFSSDQGKAYIARTPARRLGTLDELSLPLLMFASPRSGFTTGTALPIDGGHSVRLV